MMIRRILLLLGALLVFGAVNWQIVMKERLRTGGQTVFLELAPADPRSPMQGDYMALSFVEANRIVEAVNTEVNGPHVAVLQLDARGVGRFSRLDNGGPLKPDEVRFRFRVRDGLIWMGTNAFFMQEGDAERYSKAHFGEFHVTDSGEAMLVNLRGDELQKL